MDGKVNLNSWHFWDYDLDNLKDQGAAQSTRDDRCLELRITAQWPQVFMQSC
jgi:hypothetical protein